ncbi:MAG: hypothetical protein QXU09_02650 [Thermoproteota archaeon]
MAEIEERLAWKRVEDLITISLYQARANRVREQWRVVVHVAISLMTMLLIALTATKLGRRDLAIRISPFKF